MNNPTPEQLADPQWWDDNAPDGATQFALEDEDCVPCWVKGQQGWLYPLDNSWDFLTSREIRRRTLVDRPLRTVSVAHSTIKAAMDHIDDRAKTYDCAEGERSIPSTVEAFNSITGHNITEEQGWLFMMLLKAVRSQQGDFKLDNYEDGVAYFGLMAESAAKCRSHDKEQNNEHDPED